MHNVENAVLGGGWLRGSKRNRMLFRPQVCEQVSRDSGRRKQNRFPERLKGASVYPFLDRELLWQLQTTAKESPMRRFFWFAFSLVLASFIVSFARAGEIGFLEDFALAKDRPAVL